MSRQITLRFPADEKPISGTLRVTAQDGRTWTCEVVEAQTMAFMGMKLIERPDLPAGVIVIAQPSPYPFSLKPGFCSRCDGTGEIIEFPADEDERTVCCPACGGTGEALTMTTTLTQADIDGHLP